MSEAARRIAADLNAMASSPWSGQVVAYDIETGEPSRGDLGREQHRPMVSIRGQVVAEAPLSERNRWSAARVRRVYEAQMRELDSQREWVAGLLAELERVGRDSGRGRDLCDQLNGIVACGEWPSDIEYPEWL